MKVKFLTMTVLAMALANPVSALEIGSGTSKTITNVQSKTKGHTFSIDHVNGIEVNRLKKGDKRAKRVTRYGSLDKSSSFFKEKTKTKMVDKSRFMYVGDLVTGTGYRTVKSKTKGISFTKDMSLSWYRGFEKNRDGAGNYSKERFSGFESTFAKTKETYNSKTFTKTNYHFSE